MRSIRCKVWTICFLMLCAFVREAIASEDGAVIRKSLTWPDGGIQNEYLIQQGKCEIGADVNHFIKGKQTITLYQTYCSDDYDKIFKTWGVLIKEISRIEEMRDYYFMVDKQLDFGDEYFRAEIIKILSEGLSDQNFLIKHKEYIWGRDGEIGLATQYYLSHPSRLNKLFSGLSETIKSAGWSMGTIGVANDDDEDDLYGRLNNEESRGIKLPMGKTKILVPSFARIVFQVTVPSVKDISKTNNH